VRPSTSSSHCETPTSSVEVDAGLDSFALEQVDEILRRDVAGRARREGTAAEAADGGVEHASAPSSAARQFA
jgi:hypothetical protein